MTHLKYETDIIMNSNILFIFEENITRDRLTQLSKISYFQLCGLLFPHHSLHEPCCIKAFLFGKKTKISFITLIDDADMCELSV